MEGISATQLRTAHDEADDATATTRLVVALASTDGVRVGVLVECSGIPQSTIYDWLDRLEKQPVADAILDERYRSGRTPPWAPRGLLGSRSVFGHSVAPVTLDGMPAQTTRWTKPPDGDRMERSGTYYETVIPRLEQYEW